ncbi:hypothetical protein ACFL0V_02630 [Nanoarchaeota archaeon]
MRDVSTAIATILLGLTVVSAHPDPTGPPMPHQDPGSNYCHAVLIQENHTVDQPVVDTNLMIRTWVEGIPPKRLFRSLTQLAADSDLEEAWAYMPQTETLIETGYLEKSDEVRVDTPFLLELIRNNDEVYELHIHPPKHQERKDLAKKLSTLPETPGNYLKAAQQLGEAAASRQDVYAMLSLYASATEENPDVNLRSFVVSEHGVVEYTVTPLGLEYFSQLSKDERLDFATDYRDNLEATIQHTEICGIATISEDVCPQEAPEDIMTQALEGISTDYIQLSFTPTRDL